MRGVVIAWLALLPAMAGAHDSRPLSITLVEQAAGTYRSTVRIPPTISADNQPQVRWPAACDLVQSAPLATAPGSFGVLDCGQALAGSTLGIDYPLYNPSITAIVRIENSSGIPVTAVLAPDEFEWTVPAEPTRLDVARNYTILGFSHIWEGPDHLLFVAGLLLLAGSLKRIVIAVTGFTIAHSITLSLAVLGLVDVPIAPVEAMIALSILLLAAEVARNDPASLSQRFPVVLSFGFGLLHGFGFASALGEIGLPRTELVTGLLFFNVGVELGQLAFIAAAAAVAVVASGIRARRPGTPAAVWPLERRAGLALAYCLGVPAAFWFFERTTNAFAG
ncbi:MAG: HupE/UreJ family protein [Gammaproteobacteria bacterium]|nr:HupE/UreJ family protein [Gammaproteobacteria bacterium]